MRLRMWTAAALAPEALAILGAPGARAAPAQAAAALTFEIDHGASAAGFAWRDGGDLVVGAETIAALGLAAPANAASVRLSAIPGLTYRIDAARAAVEIECTAACYAPHTIGAPPAPRAEASPLTAAALNYDLTASAAAGAAHAGGVFEGVLSRAGLAADVSALADTAAGARRLESGVTIDDPDRRRRLRLGDAISTPGAWGAPARFGGIKFGTDFTLDPAFVTYPTPRLSGAAALASTVDVFVDNVLRQSSAVAPGPFTIGDPPFVTGAGSATIVVKDLLGREQAATQNFYVAPRLLKAGLSDYTLDAGFLRAHYAEPGDAYTDGFAALTWRRGLSDNLTVEARAEGERGAYAAGLTLAGALYPLGEGEIALARSESAAGSGLMTHIGWARVSGAWSAAASFDAASGAFRGAGEDGPPDRRRESVSFGWAGPHGGALSLALIGADGQAGRARAWSGAYALPLGGAATLHLSALRADRPAPTLTFSIAVSAILGPRRSVSAQIAEAPGGARYETRAQEAPAPDGGWGWSLAAAAGAAPRIDAGVRARLPTGEAEAAFSHAGGADGVRLGLRGALVATRGDLYWTRALRGAFALVEAPAGMAVMLDHRVIGRTDLRGRLLAPDLRPNQVNRLSIRAEEAPLDARIGATDMLVRPPARGGALARFPIEREEGRWVRIEAPDGAPAPEGVVLTREGDGARFFVEAGGRAYIASAAHAHMLTASMDGVACTVDAARAGDVARCAPR